MRIIFFNENWVYGGSNKYIEDLITIAFNEGHEIEYLINYEGFYKIPSGVKNIKISKINTLNIVNKVNILFQNHKYLSSLFKILILIKPIFFLINVLRFIKIIKHKNADLIISCNGGYPGSESCSAIIIASKILKKPNILSIASMPQRRKRVYIMAYKSGSPIYKHINNLPNIEDWITTNGVMQKAFPMRINNGNLLNTQLSFDNQEMERFDIKGSLENLYEDKTTFTPTNRPFKNVGIIKNKTVITYDALPEYYGDIMSLGDVLQDEEDIPPEFYITPSDMERWLYLKGAKNEPRTTKTGIDYHYSEGAVTFPDALDKPSRTIITGEGGRAPSRFKHVIEVSPGKYRRLTPIELERLNMFDDNHTQEAADTKRAFLMGNALVVGVVEKLGKSLHHKHYFYME